MTEYAGNLAASLHDGARITPDDAARSVLPLVEALVADHERGVVHGVLDPAYVAPEITAGAKPTTATDVWSVGALLFHAMAGHTPFKHSSQPPARLRRAGWLGPLVEIAISTDPADRPSMREVAACLRDRQPIAVPEPPPPSPIVEAASVATDDAAPRRRTAMALLVLAALVVSLGAVAVVLALGHHTDAPAPITPPSAKGGSAPTAHHARSPGGHAKPVTTRALESFARRYVATASSDPSAGFEMLTASYQQESPRYRQFWSAVRDPEILTVHARPRRLTVTYTYRYLLAGDRHTETVTLDLVRRGRQLLITGAG